MKLLSLGVEDERLLLSLATHESGHAVCALHFGLGAKCFIGGPRSAICKHDPGTCFQNSCVSWAGVLAEDLTANRHPDRKLPGCELTRENLTGWIVAMIAGGLTALSRYSAPDAAGIESHPDKFATGRAAFQILTANLDLLREFADELCEESRMRFRQNENDFARAERWCLAAH